MTAVPIKSKALQWAVSESGYTRSALEEKLRLEQGTLARWIVGESQPTRTEFTKLRKALKRPAALFFMASPPERTEPSVSMRYSLGANPRKQTPEERSAIRDALRISKFVGQIKDSLQYSSIEFPNESTNDDPENVASSFRSRFFDVPLDEQTSWKSASDAFRKWRNMIEALGLMVFLYPLGKESARGFALASENSAVIGVSTTWDPAVRVYTLLHEVAHILTRTSSLCVEASNAEPSQDPIERWCERFAASFLLPKEPTLEIAATLSDLNPIQAAGHISKTMGVSRKAALIRLIEINKANWSDFNQLNPKHELRRSGGRPDREKKRTRDVTKQDKYGSCLKYVHEAYQSNLVTESDIRTYLQMYPDELA